MNQDFEINFNYAIIQDNGKSFSNDKDVVIVSEDANGVAIETQTSMTAGTCYGVKATKYITINDKTGETVEAVTAKRKDNQYWFKNAALTRYRCAEMTCLSIKMLHGQPRRVGFIGTGKTNLDNCIMINKMYGVEDIVIRGSKRNLAKNAGDYMAVCKNVSIDTSDGMKLMNECDVVVVCTSSYKKDEMISAGMLSGPKLIVCLDCGYYLDESFRRNRVSVCDSPKQLTAHYKDEFPFDESEYEFRQMDYFAVDKNEKAVVYLYGVAIADAVAADRLVRRLEMDGMDKVFLQR